MGPAIPGRRSGSAAAAMVARPSLGGVLPQDRGRPARWCCRAHGRFRMSTASAMPAPPNRAGVGDRRALQAFDNPANWPDENRRCRRPPIGPGHQWRPGFNEGRPRSRLSMPEVQTPSKGMPVAREVEHLLACPGPVARPSEDLVDHLRDVGVYSSSGAGEAPLCRSVSGAIDAGDAAHVDHIALAADLLEQPARAENRRIPPGCWDRM